MSLALKLSEEYFLYSNQSNLTSIAKLLSTDSTYYSASLGFFIGKENIIAMQTDFHSQYKKLHWGVDKVTEIKPNVIEIEFSFKGTSLDGLCSNRQGREHILVIDGLIQHIAVGL